MTPRSRPLRSTGALVVALLTASACAPTEKKEGRALCVMLPFTGERASVAHNLERGALMAADLVNDGGGVRGQPIRIYSRDTRSTNDDAVQAAEDCLEEDSLALIGPEGVTESREVWKFLEGRGIPYFSPFIADALEDEEASEPWWRLAPSPIVLGESLARRVHGSGERSIVVATGTGEYSQLFAQGVRERFVSLGGEIAGEIDLSTENARALDALSDQEGASTLTVVLSADVKTAVPFVNESTLAKRNRTIQWWFSPSLQTEEFTRNVIPEAVDGARGVAPGVVQDGGEFASAFAQRWDGDVPTIAAHYYYDAIVLLALALESAEGEDLESIAAGMKRITTAVGVQVSWDEVDKALSVIRKGDRVFYQGITGSTSFDSGGERRSYLFDWWKIEDDAIQQDF